nr:hypothetical protein [uncultured Brevundimonas sp.]
MSGPLPLSERLLLIAELEARIAPTKPHPKPHPKAKEALAPGSEENARLVQQALALGMGQFAKMTADETHRFAARLSRR